ncbi:phosphopantetheine-binding protein [Pseudomonas sp. CAN2814]|uniref:phosphopantetheine-binding protein n=1 Tax=Pseudomonas sp. CAN1 TaxID=3046726 RepID=UPI00264A3112|nr:phosphopantetheine-binding protein [Pseudomonas sp. CAN1]MDN6856455.1 phosphopantetheine-binding protein [Pseudomonas sp. CAN1]
MAEKFYAEVIEAIERNVAGLKLSEDKMGLTLADLGVDSLDVMLVLVDVQEKTGITIPEEQADLLKTPAQIIAFLQANA